jgi:uncharacterized protein
MKGLVGFVAGIVFGLGLVVSGMANPAKVLNFLDLAGKWDPSLAFVMAGAMLVTMIGYRWAFQRPTPVLDVAFHLPIGTHIDRQLLVGSGLFGIGWGLSGLCPGPAITGLALLAPGLLAFVPAMIAGIAVGRWWQASSHAGNEGTRSGSVFSSSPRSPSS